VLVEPLNLAERSRRLRGTRVEYRYCNGESFAKSLAFLLLDSICQCNQNASATLLVSEASYSAVQDINYIPMVLQSSKGGK
jgi:hypothetical protein